MKLYLCTWLQGRCELSSVSAYTKEVVAGIAGSLILIGTIVGYLIYRWETQRVLTPMESPEKLQTYEWLQINVSLVGSKL